MMTNAIVRDEILEKTGASHDNLLGEGVEAEVYAIDDDTVVRIYKHNPETRTKELTLLENFYATLHDDAVSFKVPHIYSVSKHESIVYTIDRRLRGTALGDILATLPLQQRQAALEQYLSVSENIHLLREPYDYFGEVLAAQPVRKDTWRDFLNERVQQDYQHARELFDKDVSDMSAIVDFFRAESELVAGIKKAYLVHGDFNAMNVLADNHGMIEGVVDFNALTLAGDPRMDLASGIIGFMEGEDGLRREDGNFLLSKMIEKHGENIKRVIHLYRLYYAIHFASYCKETDPRTYEWSIRTLNEHIAGTYHY